MNEVIVLDVHFQFGEVSDIVHPVVLKDDAHLVLIDCGYTGFLPIIEKAMEDHGLRCKDLTHVVITHQDHDHMGALSALKENYPEVQIVASALETPYISGTLSSLRLEQAEAMQESLPQEQKAFGQKFCHILKAVQPAPVDLEVCDGDSFDWCGGCTIVGTPGHTPGHISLFLNEQNIMITGDAAVIEQEDLAVANPQYALNLPMAEVSLAKIQSFGAKKFICYHGGVLIPSLYK